MNYARVADFVTIIPVFLIVGKLKRMRYCVYKLIAQMLSGRAVFERVRVSTS